MIGGLPKIRSVHTYVLKGFILVVSTVYWKPIDPVNHDIDTFIYFEPFEFPEPCYYHWWKENPTFFFWPRAMLKGPKRSFVVLVLVVGVESSSKNVQNGTKIVQGNQKCAFVVHCGNCRVCLVWPYVALYGLICPCMALYGLVCPCVALCGLECPCMSMYDIIRLSMTLCDLVWSCMALYSLFMVSYGILWSFMAE